MHNTKTDLLLAYNDRPLPSPAKPEYLPINRVVGVESILETLGKLGVNRGDILFVHSASSSLGYIAGGPRTLIDGMLTAVGPSGTIVLPTFTGDNSDPVRWKAPPVASHAVRKEVLKLSPPYDPILSIPWKRVGQIALLATLWPGAVRSFHPQTSFVAIGAMAEQICGGLEDKLDYPLSPTGVLGRLNDLNSKVLFIGTEWTTCTALHITEFTLYQPVPDYMSFEETSVISVKGQRAYVKYKMFTQNTDDFAKIGSELESLYPQLFNSLSLEHGKRALLFPMKEIVDLANPIMKKSRGL